MACSVCRRRRFRCDNGRPTCSACLKNNRQCEYRGRTARRGSTTNNPAFGEHIVSYNRQTDGAIKNPDSADFLATVDAFAQYAKDRSHQDSFNVDTTPDESDTPLTPFGFSVLDDTSYSEVDALDLPSPVQDINDLELVGKHDHHPLLNDKVKEELTTVFFRDVYPGIPIIHKSRYYASLELEPELQPPLCLRYAMWALAAIQHQQWTHIANHLYEKARTCLEQDELRGLGTEILNVAHVQCWSLIATYESYMLLSLRTWSSIRRAAALAHVLHLHTIDEPDDVVGQLLPEPQHPSELEERRRAFWSAFASDRWISTSTGYPMTMSDMNITTNLPSSEDSFNSGSIEQTQSLDAALEMGLDSATSLFGSRAVMACILGRIMRHVESATKFSKSRSNQQFWKQHSLLDALLLRVSKSRSAHLRPSRSTTDPKIWAMDIWVHGLSICLHQTSVDCATQQDNKCQALQSIERCRKAADQIVVSIRSIAHIETKKMDPFTASCVYMAAKVLIRAHADGNGRATDIEDLKYLQKILELMHRHWKVTEVFITQFNDDLSKNGISLLTGPSLQPTIPSRKRAGQFETPHRRFPSDHLLDRSLPV